MNRLLDVQDLFAVGVGLDISGGYLVARGLLLSPGDISRLAGTYLGFNPHEVVARSKDRIDVAFGLVYLMLGFVLQASGYVISVGITSHSQPSIARLVVALALIATSVLLSQMVASRSRKHWLLNFLVEVAMLDDDGNRQRYPINERIVSFAKALGFELTAGEDGLALARRVFGEQRVKDLLVRGESGYGRVSDLRGEEAQSGTEDHT